MIGGRLYGFFFQSQKRSSLLFTRAKYFSPKGVPHTRYPSGFSKFGFLLISNIGRSNNIKKGHCIFQGVKLLCFQNFLVQILKDGLLKIPLTFKEHSVQVMKMCARQCECVLALRIRRGQQMFSLYTKLWDEVALRELVSKMKSQFARRGKEFLLSVAGVSAFSWDKIRIPDNELLSYMNEIENVYRLRDATLVCEHCHMRLAFDVRVPNVQYCHCKASKIHFTSEDNWSPFLERQDLIVWRKEDPQCRGIYAYKVYGSYDDVTANDFLRVQLDIDYRKEWDCTAVELTILDSDPATNSDVIYWVMKWPRMFSNRDYVFNRRYSVDEKEKVMVVVNKGTEHPECPERYENVRVKEYWSSMVIRPHKEFSEPGIEFCLTYFDDPGVSIPSAITSWVAVSGLPDFLTRVRQAARELALRRGPEDTCIHRWLPVVEPPKQGTPETPPDSAVPTHAPTPPNSAVPTHTPTPPDSAVPTHAPTPPNSAVPMHTPTPSDSAVPTHTPTPPVSAVPTHTPAPPDSAVPTHTPTPPDSAVPTDIPTPPDSAVPTDIPTPPDSAVPTHTPGEPPVGTPMKIPLATSLPQPDAPDSYLQVNRARLFL